METMKALLLVEYNKLVYTDVPMPVIQDDEVLVNVKATAVCGSDIHGYDGGSGRRRPPLVMGHEASGVIAKLGKNVKGYKAGDRVTFDSTLYCGECDYCKQGLFNLCNSRRILGVSCADYHCEGTFAEYVAVPERVLYPLPDSVSFENAALIEPLSIGFHAINITPLALGDNALVVGAGTIGQMIIKLLAQSSVSRIIVSDLDETKLEKAKQSGADYCFGKGCDLVAEVKKLTGGKGVDAAFEAVGIKPTLTNAIMSTKKNGHVTLVGNVTPEVGIPLQIVSGSQLTLHGSAASCGEYPRCIEMLSSGAVEFSNVISAVVPLQEGAPWIDRLHAMEQGLMKVVLIP